MNDLKGSTWTPARTRGQLLTHSIDRSVNRIQETYKRTQTHLNSPFPGHICIHEYRHNNNKPSSPYPCPFQSIPCSLAATTTTRTETKTSLPTITPVHYHGTQSLIKATTSCLQQTQLPKLFIARLTLQSSQTLKHLHGHARISLFAL